MVNVAIGRVDAMEPFVGLARACARGRVSYCMHNINERLRSQHD